jgi:hypothetical protein
MSSLPKSASRDFADDSGQFAVIVNLTTDQLAVASMLGVTLARCTQQSGDERYDD